ncbi:MAG: M50 family metallopeptidase [Candidatus Helarchaeota archaeon]|nr:M50 family metallopeptidase [Candidatus Helarchaeota archaeon]
MGKRGFVLLSLLILVSSLFTIFYFVNSYCRAYNNHIETQFYELHDIYFFNSSHGWIVGSSGHIFITRNGGEFWEKYQINALQSFIQVQFASDQNGWILERNSGEIYKSKDGGLNWNLQTEDVPFEVTSFYFINVTTGWATTSSGLILKTINGGNQWNIQLNITPSRMLKMVPPIYFNMSIFKSIYFMNESQGWALYQGNTSLNPTNLVFRTDNSGNSWVNYSIPSQLYRKILFVDQFNGWIIGDHGAFIFTNDSGITWNKFNLTDASLFDLHFLNESHGWVCGTFGTLFYTQNGGKNWIDLSDPSNTRNFKAIFFQNESKGWGISWTHTSFVSFDGGYAWYLVRLDQIDPFYFNNSWIWVLLASDTIFIILSTYLILNYNKIKRSRIMERLRTILSDASNTLFTVETKTQMVISCIFILCLIFGFNFLFSLIHEYGHGFSAILHGGYYEYIEMDLTGYGRVYISGTFTSFERVLIYFAGFLSELIVATVLICILFLYFRRSKLLSFMSIIIYLVGILGVFFYYGIIQMSPNPIGGTSDIFRISGILHVPPFVICLFLIPFFILALYLGGKLVLYFYRMHLDSKKPFLIVLLVGILISLGIVGIFITLPKNYGIIFY